MNARPFIFGLFFLSGFCGLAYQTVWLRLAYAAFGITTPVLSVVLSVFMLGLALGSWWAGRRVEAWSQATGRSALFLYAAAEVMIGLGGLCVPGFFSLGRLALLSRGESDSAGYLFFSALVLLVSLLPWCLAMGATFPLMMRFIRESIPESTSFSFLYLGNVLGAFTGTLATAFVLVELFGFQGTLRVVAGINFSIALGSFVWARQVQLPRLLPRSLPKGKTKGMSSFILGLLFLTGLSSMGMEVAWLRNFTPVLGNETYAFASLLSVYLLATGLGSWFYRIGLRKARTLSPSTLLGLLSLFAPLPIVLNDPALHATRWMALASLVPFCAGLGYLTPSLLDQGAGGDPQAAGKGYALNILGCILGPLLSSYALLPHLGARWSLIAWSLPFLFGGLAPSTEKDRRYSRLASLAALPLLLFAAFGCGSYEEGFPGMRGDRFALRRDTTATVLSYQDARGPHLLVNGIGMTGMNPVVKVMAHWPMLLCRQAPRSTLVICFGMGSTFRSLASWGVETTAVELVPSVRDAFGFYFEDAGTVLQNPQDRVVIDDGRRFLDRTDGKFDVITLDPPPPVGAAGSSLLYSEEFYKVLKGHLRRGGIVQQWFPRGEVKTLQAFTRAFVGSFPYVRAFAGIHDWGFHLLGSMEPIEVPPAGTLLSRLPPAARKDLVEWNKTDNAEVFLNFIASRELVLDSLLDPDSRMTVTDDRPFNEYFWLRRTFPRLFKY